MSLFALCVSIIKKVCVSVIPDRRKGETRIVKENMGHCPKILMAVV